MLLADTMVRHRGLPGYDTKGHGHHEAAACINTGRWQAGISYKGSSYVFFCLFVCFFVCFSFVVPETDLSKKVSTPLLNHTHPTKARHMLGAEQVAHRPCAHFSLNKWGEEVFP